MVSKKIVHFTLLYILLFVLGFLLSWETSIFLIGRVLNNIGYQINGLFLFHYNTFRIYPDARHYFIFPDGGYLRFFIEGIHLNIVIPTLSNVLFNALFQPLFLCIFTPQTILTYLLLPFFIYAAVKYFKKVPIMVLFLVGFLLFIGIKDSVVEPLIRHRMVCELIYFCIGSAGLADWITRRSS